MKIKKISVIFIILMLLITYRVYAKYSYNFEFIALDLTRDNNPPNFEIAYSNTELTNQNVIVTIKFDKEIEAVSGFVLSEDKKTLTKEVTENEEKILKVKDLNGNFCEVEYNVSNIDKELPQIKNCENGGTYSSPLTLEYSDNVEIAEISVDKYEDNLELYISDGFYYTPEYFGLDRLANSLKVNIRNHPLNTKRYKLYLNGEFYATTDEDEFTFTDLSPKTEYKIKVEALNLSGEILDSKEITSQTTYIKSYNIVKRENIMLLSTDCESNVYKIYYKNYNYYDKSTGTPWTSYNNNSNFAIMVDNFNTDYYPLYHCSINFYDKDLNIIDVVEYYVDFQGELYSKKEINKNELTETGNYQIIIKDTAGNEITYYIKIE